jgi:DNA-binding XRE family transcriptional regulator
MPMPRKIDLTPTEHAVCDQVIALRRDIMRMSQGRFAQQVGTTRRTVARWEKHIHCPRSAQIRRLKELQELWSNLDMRDRLAGDEVSFTDKPRKRVKLLPSEKVRQLSYRLLGRVLKEVCGGRVRIPKPELHGGTWPKVQMRYNPERNEYVAFVRRTQAPAAERTA